MKTNKTIRNAVSAVCFEAMEQRQMMSASAVKSIDSGGPDGQMLTTGGVTYVISSKASGGGWQQLYSSKGPASTTKQLLDFTKTGSTLSSIDDMVGTADGRVFFTAVGGTNGGRQLFQLNTSKGGYTQITKDTGAFYTDVMAVGNKIYAYDSNKTQIITIGSNNSTVVVADTTITKWFQAKGQVFYVNGDLGIFRTDGTAPVKISGTGTVNSRTIFTSNDYIYFEATENNLASLYRSNGSSTTPTNIAEDFSLLNASSAELGDYVYFSGGYYNTSPSAEGQQLYRVKTSTGEVSVAAKIVGSNGAGRPDAIKAVGTNIYFVAGDGDYLTSQGTTDRELYRYDTLTQVNKKITTGELLAPVDDAGDGGGAGVLSSYYFVAAPDKDNFRFGDRKLYRTDPSTDTVEEVTGVPTMHYSTAEAEGFAVGPGGLFINVDLGDNTGDTDTFFVATPYSYIDPVSHVLTIEATESADTLTITVDGDELVMNLNGIEERQDLADFTSIAVALKAGDDKLTTNASVTRGMSVNGDSGNDTMTTGSGNDSILGGSGKNYFYGGAGDDRLRGSNGVDIMEGGAGKDRMYGRAGNDYLHGNDGVDVIYGDDEGGPYGNDQLWGEASNDKLYGYGGDDVFYGGNQNDSIFAGEGNDTLYGQDGNDTLDGGAGLDEMWGGIGDDVFIANDGQLDKLYGQAGNDSATKDTNESIVDQIEL